MWGRVGSGRQMSIEIILNPDKTHLINWSSLPPQPEHELFIERLNQHD